jgi:chromate reductase
MPGALKNCLDVGSRPWGKSVWGGKPAAVVSVSPGVIGGFGANHHLRQVLMAVGAVAMPHPEAYVGGAAGLFDDQGELTDASARDVFAQIMVAFQAWVERQLR